MKKTISVIVSAASLLAAMALFVCENPREFENPLDKEGSNYLYGRPYDTEYEQHCTSVNDGGVALLFTGDSGCNGYVAPDTGTPVITLDGSDDAEVRVGDAYRDAGVTVTVGGSVLPTALDSVVVKGPNNYNKTVRTSPDRTIDFTEIEFSTAAAGTYTITYYASYKGASMSVAKTATETRTVKVLAATSPPEGNKISETVNEYTFEMVFVAKGNFTMGCTDNECYDWEMKQHTVRLTKDYYIGKYEVTQGLWKAVMGSLPSSISSSYGMNDNYPVYYVSWYDVQIFLDSLNSKTRRTGNRKYQLPTEAEWEYAARGGGNSHNYKYSGNDNIDTVAWYYGNSDNTTHPVGTKSPNELGIYDMSGNVLEWVNDWWGAEPAAGETRTNPTGPNTVGYARVLRGGSWFNNYVRYCRVSFRDNTYPDYSNNNIGFRLALLSP
jgi:formylglycine-generating enzyme required for sulfatase activity